MRSKSTLPPPATVSGYLNEWHQEMLSLSPNAQKVYCAVAHLLRDRNATSIWLDDAQVSRRAKVLIQFIGPAQSELARAGLLHLDPGETQTRYELVTTEDEAAQ